MPDAPDNKAQQAQIQALMRGPMPRLYANGFGIAQSSSDIGVVMLHNNAPIGMLSMSFISAKSLVADLKIALDSIEAALNQEIPTISEVSEKLEKTLGPSNG